ncbi:MAG: hypothetical protein LBS30_03360 [Planctomycetota bacterium]|jgi:hypothetical protein|nr:hypothetical protein [Planctomycetota bacterium]
MAIGGINAANDTMATLMQTLMKGMQESADLSKNMITVGVENRIIGEKMGIANAIVVANGGVDVYA